MRKVVGIHSCKAALEVRSSEELQKIYFRPGWQSHPSLKELEKLAIKKGLVPEILSLKKLSLLSQNHQGVAVYVKGHPPLEMDKLSEKAVILILEGVEDPKNLGAVIRTAWLMGVEGIFVSRHHSAGLTPSVMKAAAGGVEYVPVESVNISRCLEMLKRRQFQVYGLEGRSSHSLWQENFEGRVAFVLGGEQSGLKSLTKKACDRLLSIPQREVQASYNVSVSAAVVLSECFRQIKV